MGERSTGFFTVRGEGPFDVCELCLPKAGRFGLRPTPSDPDELVRQGRRTGVSRSLNLFGAVRDGLTSSKRAPRVRELQSTPVGAAAVPVALAAFNESEHARMLAGLQRTLGEPRASVVPRSPTDREVIVTVAWEIVWYQFRISPDGSIAHERGTYLTDLPGRWQHWNCRALPSGRVSPPDINAQHQSAAQHYDMGTTT